MDWPALIWLLVGLLCGIVIGAVVTYAVLRRRTRPSAPFVPVAMDVGGGLDAVAVHTINQLIARGERIAAIKLYRRATGEGLAESTTAIDTWTGRPPAG